MDKVAKDKSAIVAALPKACSDESTAVEFLEAQRWNGSPFCPRCEAKDVYQLRGRDGKRNKRFLWVCRDCGDQFTVRINTVFEDSRIPLRHWCYAFWAACASKKGVSALQIKRQTGLSYKSALFLMHRIRYAMTPPRSPRLDGTVEVDETYVGGKPRNPSVQQINAMTYDERKPYFAARNQYRGRGTKKVPVVALVELHVNTAESFFALLKRGLVGTFHAVSKRHLHRYVNEFAFRWNHRRVEDGERTVAAIRGAVGKRLMYKQPRKG